MKTKHAVKAILSVVLTLAMLLTSAWVPQLAIKVKADAPTETVIDPENPVTEWSGNIVVKEDVTTSNNIYLTGDTVLTIAKGKTLTANSIMYKEGYTGNASLTINGGTLLLNGAYGQGIQLVDLVNSATGIGTLTVNSGKVKLTANGAGINSAGFVLNGGSVELNGYVNENITLAGGAISTSSFENSAKVTVAEGYTYLVENTVNLISSGEFSGEYANENYTNNGLIGLVPCVAKVTSNKGDEYHTKLNNAILAANGATVTLIADVDIDTSLVIEGTVTLDLNGHTIDRGVSAVTENYDGNVIMVKGTLTLQDSGTGGTIKGGYGLNGGGVCIYKGATFNMEGGTITGCCSSGLGGGVYVAYEGGVFNMTGGTITGCSAEAHGGGVYVCGNGGVFNMTGGSIVGCSAQIGGGGVEVGENGIFTVSGSPVISGNKKGSDTNNVVFESNIGVIGVSGALTSGAEIYVTPIEAGIVAQPDKTHRTEALTATEATYFKSDSTTYSPALSESGTVVFKAAPVGVDEPALNDGLTYNGTEHDLVEHPCTVE